MEGWRPLLKVHSHSVFSFAAVKEFEGQNVYDCLTTHDASIVLFSYFLISGKRESLSPKEVRQRLYASRA